MFLVDPSPSAPTPAVSPAVKAAALAALLVPLASVGVTHAESRNCGSGGAICGIVWQDLNQDGLRDVSEPVIEGAVVTLAGYGITATDGAGRYQFPWYGYGSYQVSVAVPPGMRATLANQGTDDTIDSDGLLDAQGIESVAAVTLDDTHGSAPDVDFGFVVAPVQNPGTGTPGYWMNHPEGWPASVTVGGRVYTAAEAIAWIQRSGKDRTTTMFASLVSAKLNVGIGNDASCIEGTIAEADAWMATYGPVGSNIHAASLAWKIGEPLHRTMDNYNNGMLCAPHRD